MPLFNCQLDHHPLVRLNAADAAAAKAEYFRRYAILSSTAEWRCKQAGADGGDGSRDPAPTEPEAWVKRREQLGTLEEQEERVGDGAAPFTQAVPANGMAEEPAAKPSTESAAKP